MTSDKTYTDLAYMTGVINTLARHRDLDLYYTRHCKERMQERGITTLDIMNVLRFGMVEEFQGRCRVPEGMIAVVYKYKMVGKYLGCPKSIREIGIVILVEAGKFREPAIKIQEIITVMWQDL